MLLAETDSDTLETVISFAMRGFFSAIPDCGGLQKKLSVQLAGMSASNFAEPALTTLAVCRVCTSIPAILTHMKLSSPICEPCNCGAVILCCLIF